MKLYVCWGTFKFAPRPGGHPCGNAYHALVEAGHEPEVIRSYGYAPLGPVLNSTPGRQEVKRLTGNYWVPALVTDDGAVVQGTAEIIDWARTHPSPAADAAAAGTG